MNEKLFSQLLKKNYDKFIRYAENLTHNPETAKDLVQESSIKALKSLESLEKESSFVAWFYRVIYSVFLTVHAKKKRRRELSQTKRFSDSLIISKRKPKNKALQRLAIRDIQLAMGNLKKKYKKCFILYSRGYSYKEISKKCDIPVGTVKSRINMARHKLRKEMKALSISS